MRLAFSILAAATLLQGCATIQTTSANSASGEGIEYALPKGEFVLEVREGAGYVAATLIGPVVRQDNNARYRTTLLSSGIASNDFTIEVNNRGLLSSLSGSSDGQLAEIAKKAARTVAYQSDSEESGKLVYSTIFSVATIKDAQDRANASLAAHRDAICAEKTDKGKDTPACVQLRKTLARTPGPFIVLDAESLPVAPSPNSGPRPRNGNILYYRPLISVRIGLRLGDGQGESKTFAIPDETRTNWVSVAGGVFAKQEHEFQFTDGVLTKQHRIARNEVVGLVSLPVDVAKEIIAAPFEALNDRKAGIEAQTGYLNAVTALQTANADAEKACSNYLALCQDLPLQTIKLSTGTRQTGSGSQNPSPAPSGGPSDGSGKDPNEGI